MDGRAGFRFYGAENIIKKELRRNPTPMLYVTYGNLFELQSDMEKADKQYDKAIQSVSKRRSEVTQLAHAFIRATKYDLAVKVFEKGGDLLKDDKVFALNLGDLYKRKGDTKNMIKYYLIAVENIPEQAESIKGRLSRELSTEGMDTLQQALYEKIQETPDIIEFPEMLLWVFTQQKEYKRALRQAKALDLRLDEDGGRVFNIANIAATFIIIFRIPDCLNNPTKKPNEKSAGTVNIPKIAMIIAPEMGLDELAAVIAKKYTNPQGKSPFKIPKKKKLPKL